MDRLLTLWGGRRWKKRDRSPLTLLPRRHTRQYHPQHQQHRDQKEPSGNSTEPQPQQGQQGQELYGATRCRNISGIDHTSPLSPPPSPTPLLPLPLPAPGRGWAGVIIRVSFFLAAAALLRPVLPESRLHLWQHLSFFESCCNDERSPGAMPRVFEGEGKGNADDKKEAGGRNMRDRANWIRVRSPAAMHPAMYVPADGLVYCPIAKAACAEWRKTLRWMLGIPDWDKGPIHEQGKNGIPLLARRKIREVELIMNDHSWLKFVVVRDPADRLLSAFLNKCVGKEWGNCPYVEFMPHRFKGVMSRSPATDEKFLTSIVDEPRKVFRDFMLGVREDVASRGCDVNSHWRPQHCFCSISRFRAYYHVIPFANMSMEAVALVDRMHLPSPDRAELLREFMVNRFSSNRDAKAQGATSKREKYFSREVLDVIESVYTRDYDLFGEQFERHSASHLQ